MASLLDDELQLDEDLLADAFEPVPQMPAQEIAPAPQAAPAPPIDMGQENQDNGARPANAPTAVKQQAQAKVQQQGPGFEDIMKRTPEDETQVQGFRQALVDRAKNRLGVGIGQIGDTFASKLLGQKPMTDFWQGRMQDADEPVTRFQGEQSLLAQQVAARQRLASAAVNQMNAQAATQNAVNTARRNELYQKEVEARIGKAQAESQDRLAAGDATSEYSRVAQDRYLESLSAQERAKWEPIVRRTPGRDLPGFQAIIKREDTQQAAADKAAAAATKRAEMEAKAKAAQEEKEKKAADKEAAAAAKIEAKAQERKDVASARQEATYRKDLLPIEVKGRMLEKNFDDLYNLVSQAGPTEMLGDAGGVMRQLMSEIGVDRAKLMDPTSAAMFGEVEREMKNLWNPDTNAARFGLSKQTALKLIDNLRKLSRRRVETEYEARGIKRESPGAAPKTEAPTAKTYKVDFGGDIGVREVTADKLQAALRKQGARLVE